MLRWDEQLPPRVDNQVLRWNPEVQNILHLGNDAKNGQMSFLVYIRDGCFIITLTVSELEVVVWFASLQNVCTTMFDFWHINFGKLREKAALSNWIISSVFSLFCSCQNNHIISHDESIYQQIKRTTRHDSCFHLWCHVTRRFSSTFSSNLYRLVDLSSDQRLSRCLRR